MKVRPPYVGVLLLALAACESDEAKLQRLQGDAATQCLVAQNRRGELEIMRDWPQSAQKDSVLREWGEYDAKCKLAQRELNRFMR